MSTTEAVKNEVARIKQPKSLQQLIEEASRDIGRALPEHMRPERLVRIGLTCLRTVPELAKCTPASFLGALFTAAQVGVEPIAGMAYILPFNNKRQVDGEWKTIKEAQFVMGYRGLISLFYRNEKSVQLSWSAVHAEDAFEYQYGTDQFLRHIPAKEDRGSVVGYYVIAGLAAGGKSFLYMTRQDCLEHGRKHSKTYDKRSEKFYESSPWVTSEESMCLKTVLIQLAKLLPLSVELQRAISVDESSRDYRKGVIDIVSEPSTAEWKEVENNLPPINDAAEKTMEPEGIKTPTYDIRNKVEGVALTEISGKEAWIISFIGSGIKAYTSSKPTMELAVQSAEKGFSLKALILDKGGKNWIAEMSKA